MTLGTCVVFTPAGRAPLTPESVSITGVQDGFLLAFTVKQLFRHSSDSPADVRYIVPNNNKLCMYGTTFRIGDQVIHVSLQEKQAAEETFIEAVDEGRAALLGRNLANGLVEFSLGNIPPNQPCEVEVKCAFTASSSGDSATFFKFPLTVITPAGFVGCVIAPTTSFHFSLENCQPDTVSKIHANVPSQFNEKACTLTIS
jgi:hypothetical protein